MNIYLNLFGLVILIITIILFIVLCVRFFVYLLKKKAFPKKLLMAFLSGIMLVLVIFVYDEYFFTFSHLKGTLQEGPITSPNGNYTANAYYKPWGGAAGGVDIWVKVTNNTSKGVTKTVYYSSAYDNFSMKWKNNTILVVTNKSNNYPKIGNSSVTLDVRNEIYDQYGLACKSVLMKNDYKKCLK